MKRALLVLLLGLTGCGTVTFQGTLNANNAVTASGLVSIVRLTVIGDGNGTMINVTVVTLAQQGTAQTLTFCGSQANLFPMDQTVQVRFVPGTNCANVVEVTRG